MIPSRHDPKEIRRRRRAERGWVADLDGRYPTVAEWAQLARIRDGTSDPARRALCRAAGRRLVLDVARRLSPRPVVTYAEALEVIAFAGPTRAADRPGGVP